MDMLQTFKQGFGCLYQLTEKRRINKCYFTLWSSGGKRKISSPDPRTAGWMDIGRCGADKNPALSRIELRSSSTNAVPWWPW